MTARDWERINWLHVEKVVRRLQHRIFMAKVRGDVRRMESLQRLLTSSWYAKLLAVRTSPYQCQHPRCSWPRNDPVGRQAATVDCPSCGNKTSVYAILHACPRCRRLLESPARSAGTKTTCPGCTKPLCVPKDGVLKDRR
jgi:hypothetical protein